jgi:O-antigen/teichoic acid export membrane protein
LWVAAGYAGTSIALGLAYLPTVRNIAKLGAEPKAPSVREDNSTAPRTPGQTALQIWPFALSGFLYAAYFQGSVFLLSLIAGQEATGTFSAALSVISLGYLFPAVVFQQYLLPYLNRWIEHDHARFVSTYKAGANLMLAVSLVFTGLVTSLGPLVLPRLFGAEFSGVGPIVVCLALCFPIRFLSSTAEAVLLTERDMRRRVWCQGIGAAVGTALILLLAPRFGIWGAVAAMIGSEISVLIGYLFVVGRYVLGGGVLVAKFHGRASLVFSASVAVVGGTLALQQYHPAITMLAGLAAVGGGLGLLARGATWKLFW